MLRKIKEKVKHHLNRQLCWRQRISTLRASSARRRTSAEFVDQRMTMAKSYPDKFALLKAAICDRGSGVMLRVWGLSRRDYQLHCVSNRWRSSRFRFV